MTDYTVAQKIGFLNNMNAAAQRSQLGTMIYNAASGGYPGGDYIGRIYFVDNVNGSDTLNDGLSWNAPFKQLTAAITASETYRLSLDNVYTRQIIYVAATSTDYAPVTKLPNYTDIVGLGADPRGNGTGIVVIAGTTGDAVTGATTYGEQRGNNWYNIQFKVTTADMWCFDSVKTLRSTFENCAFMQAAATSGTLGGGFRGTDNCGGVTFKNCHFGTNSGGYLPYGIYIAGVTFNNSMIIDTHVSVLTCGIYLTGSNCTNTLIKNCTIGGGSSTQVVTGIAAGGHELIMANFITASTDAISGAAAVNTVGNQVIDNTTAAREKA